MHFDVTIVGGGVIGANVAYQLSKSKKKILLVDHRPFTSGASGRSAAMIECQIDAHRGDPFLTMARLSQDFFPDLYHELKLSTGIDFHYEQNGILQLAFNSNEAASLQSSVQNLNKIGLSADWLNPKDLNKKFPALTTQQCGAAFYKKDGQVDGLLFTKSLLKAAEAQGATLKENVQELKLKIENGKVIGVHSSQTADTSDFVVIASGAWTDQLLAPLGIQLNVKPVRGQLVVLDTPQRPNPCPIYTKKNGYITPKDGFTLVGSTIEQVGFDESTTESAKKNILEMGETLIPGISRFPIKYMTSGLRPRSLDELPIIGPLPNYQNVIVATGHYRNGFLLSPITSLLVKSFIEKSPLLIDPTPFLPGRFKLNTAII